MHGSLSSPVSLLPVSAAIARDERMAAELAAGLR